MLVLIATPVKFRAYFTSNKRGKTGLTITVDVRSPAGTEIVTAGSATEIGDGIYEYSLAANLNTAAGPYTAIFKTSDATVDVQHVPAQWVVYGSLDLSGAGTTVDCTLLGLRTELRIRLNDLDSTGNPAGNYSNTELNAFINRAYFDTMMRTKCHKETKSVALVADTHTYDAEEIFEPLEIALGTTVLDFKRIGDIGVSLERWNNTPAGTPTEWIQHHGSFFRVHPTPDSAAAGAITALVTTPTAGGTGYSVNDVLTIAGGTGGTAQVTAVNAGVVTAVKLIASGTGYTVGTGKTTTVSPAGGTGCTLEITTVGALTVHGYGIADRMTNDADTPVGVPHTLGCAAIVSRAEEYARKARSTTANNVSVASDLHADWSATCDQIITAVGGR